MIRSLCRNTDGTYRTSLPPAEWAGALARPKALLWVDMVGESPQASEPLLRETFHFHPLAIDDALNETHVPKVDDWGDYLYIAVHAVQFDRSDGGRIDTQELDIFLGKNYLVTHHDEAIAAVDSVWSNIQRDERHAKLGPDHVLYELVDSVVAAYMPVVDDIDETVDRLEDEIFAKPTSETLSRIFAFKRAVLHLRRIVSPQREVLNKLARDNYPVIDAKDRVYFRDVYDHLVRLYDINESLRDLVSGTLDTYLSVINNRMNEVMKTLTLVTTLFMPLSFLTGFFGMNFFQPVEDSLKVWTSNPAFIITLVLVFLTPVGMIWWMRHRGWT